MDSCTYTVPTISLLGDSAAGNSTLACLGVWPRDLGVLLAVMFEEAFGIEEGISGRNVCECRGAETDSFRFFELQCGLPESKLRGDPERL